MNNAIDSAIWDQVTLVPMTLHEPESHSVPHFNCLSHGNVMVPFMLPSTSCDADTCTSGIT